MASPAYCFGEFRLDPARHELWREDEEVPLPPKVYGCIVHLLDNRDRAVGRDELIAAVWGDVHLTDSALGQVIRQARQALGDSGDDQHVIQTVRGFGYRWATPVEVAEAPVSDEAEPSPAAATPATVRARSRRTPVGLWGLIAILGAGALIAGTLYLRRGTDPRADEGLSAPRAEGEIALLLPATVETGSDHAWVRLGLMDLIAERLREAGLAMVPSDTVIALRRDRGPEPGPDELKRLTATTGARLVLAPRAQVSGTRWTVSLHSLRGARPPLTVVGEAHDVLEAGRAAADRMAQTLGLTPNPQPEADRDPALERLLRQIEAARLTQQMDLARTLIEQAEPRLRRHPEVRFQWGRVEYYGHHLDAAQRTFETLLEATPAQRDPVLRARVLNGLAAIHASQGNWSIAEESLEEAARLLAGRDAPAILGTIEMNLAGLALRRGDFAAVRRHEAQARRIFQGIGAVQYLAALDRNVGVVEYRRERLTEALRYFASAAERYVAVQDVGGELRAHGDMMEARLELLDLQTAAAHEARLQELLTLTDNTELAAMGDVDRAYLLETRGEFRAADELLDAVLRAAEAGGIPSVYRAMALLLRAEREMTRGGDPARAADLAAEIVAEPADDPDMDDERARAWLVLVRARLALDRHAAAAEASRAMTAWAERRAPDAPRIYAALAEAEVAAAENRQEAAETAYERALAIADALQVPLRLLHVAQSYVQWLLDEGPHGTPDRERALALAGRLAAYADQHFDAALLQLRVYQALGPLSTWRTALTAARSLAGERQIPAELRNPPPDRATSMDQPVRDASVM